MSEIADTLSATLAREIVEAFSNGLRVFAVTSPATVAAALAARELGAAELAVAGGFTALDASPVPWVTPDERGLLHDGPAGRDWALDTFTLLARGAVGVATAPAQLDAMARANLSGIGAPERPKVALPGPRGLPDNSRSPSRVWYFFGQHSPRQLVERVDMVCGATPPPGAVRRLITPAGCFEFADGAWRTRWLAPGGAELVAGAPALGIKLTGAEPITEPGADELAAVARVDPHEVRRVEFTTGDEQAKLWMRAARREGTV